MKKFKRNVLVFTSCFLILFLYNNCSIQGGFVSNNDFESLDTDNFSAGGSSTSPISGGNVEPPTQGTSFKGSQKLGGNKSVPFRMLTAKEVQYSLEDIFNIGLSEVYSNNLLPSFSENMFTNYQDEDINVSRVHVDGLKQVASLVDGKLTNTKLLQTVPCLNNNLTDACIISITNELPLKIFRKPIDSNLKNKYIAFLNSFKSEGYKGVRLFISALIQSPSFVLRQEVGSKSGNSYTLNDYEIASRLSYFITGSTPDAELLDLASNNQLSDQTVRKTQALRLFNSARGKNNIFNINKELFRINKMNIDRGLASLFTKETENLLEDIIYKNDKPWTQLFTSSGSYLNKELASHYGLSASGDDFNWVNYQGQRSGILSHGSFLSYQYTGDPELTSPIKRGLQIVEDLLCKHLPPPSDVDVDDDPAAKLTDQCKIEARKLTTLHPKGSCFECHSFMEPLGLSLERFNMLGQYRTKEKSRPECSTIEPGQIDGVGFNSMPELGRIMAGHQDINLCLTKRVLSYAFGKFIINEHVLSYNRDLSTFNNNKTFKNLILDIANSPQFIRRDL